MRFSTRSILPVAAGIILLSAAALGEDELSWPEEGAPTQLAANVLAQNLTDRIVVFETWNDTSFLRRISEGKSISFESVPNPQKLTIPKPKAGIQSDELLQHITRHDKNLTITEDASFHVVNLMRTELVGNKAWPMNQPLGEAAKRLMTLGDVKTLLSEQFGLHLDAKGKFLGLSGRDSEAIWLPEYASRNSGNPTVRDLVNALAVKVKKPGNLALIVKPLGESAPSSSADEAEMKSKSKFNWIIM